MNRLGKLEKAQTKISDRLGKNFAVLRAGLGFAIEKVSLAVLKRILIERGHKSPLLIQNFKFNNGQREVEVDVYCESPRAILQCTSFLGANELKKVENFVNTKAFLEKESGQVFEAFFLCYGIHSSLEKRVKEILDANRIILIDGEYAIDEKVLEILARGDDEMTVK